MTNIKKIYCIGGGLGLVTGLLMHLFSSYIFEYLITASGFLDTEQGLRYLVYYAMYQGLGITSCVILMFCGLMLGLFASLIYLRVKKEKI